MLNKIFKLLLIMTLMLGGIIGIIWIAIARPAFINQEIDQEK